MAIILRTPIKCCVSIVLYGRNFERNGCVVLKYCQHINYSRYNNLDEDTFLQYYVIHFYCQNSYRQTKSCAF